MSTHYAPKYKRSNFMPSVEITTRQGRTVTVSRLLDVINPKAMSVIKNTTTVSVHKVIEGEALPNIAHRYYGTTTLYWVIAMYNGIIHPLDIEAGDLILIPDLTTINRNINNSTRVNRIGQVVTI